MEENSINKRIGEHLRMIRLRQNLSLEALAYDLDLSISTMSNIERGATGITIERLYNILQILKTDVMDFFSTVEDSPRSHIASDDIAKYNLEKMDLAYEIRKIKVELERLKRDK